MLVLSRKVGEVLVIGEILIKVTEVRGDKVRLGIIADDDINIARLEILTEEEREEVQRRIDTSIKHAKRQGILRVGWFNF